LGNLCVVKERRIKLKQQQQEMKTTEKSTFFYTQSVWWDKRILELFIKYTQEIIFKYTKTVQHESSFSYTEMRKSFFSMIISDKNIKKKKREKKWTKTLLPALGGGTIIWAF